MPLFKTDDVPHQHGFKPGDRYEGLAVWTTDYTLVDKPGFYALAEDGRQLLDPPLRLVGIDETPGDPDDTSWHLVVAGSTDPAQRAATGEEIKVVPQKIVDLEIEPIETEPEVSA